MTASARRVIRGAVLAAVVAAGWLWSPGVMAQGCAMCRTAVEGQDDPLARALSASTLFLVAMPFAVVASVGGWILFSLRRGPVQGSAEPADMDLTPDAEGDVSRGGVS